MVFALLSLIGVASAVDVEFPRSSSRLSDTFGPLRELGAGGGGVLFVDGNWVGDRLPTSLGSATYARFRFSMDDQTNSFCPVGELTFLVEINRTIVGSFSYSGGGTLGRISFDEEFEFAPIRGLGPAGTGYQVRLIADETVCGGGGSYNYFPGGTLTLL
jgi:hypothetical protein